MSVRRRLIWVFALSVLALAVAGAVVYAQPPEHPCGLVDDPPELESIGGFVGYNLGGDCKWLPDESQPLQGVKVVLQPVGGSPLSPKYSDVNGCYKFDNLAEGNYDLLLEKKASVGSTDVGLKCSARSSDAATTIRVRIPNTELVEDDIIYNKPGGQSGASYADLIAIAIAVCIAIAVAWLIHMLLPEGIPGAGTLHRRFMK